MKSAIKGIGELMRELAAKAPRRPAPKYRCAECNDTRWLTRIADDGYEEAFPCACLGRARRSALLEYIPEPIRRIVRHYEAGKPHRWAVEQALIHWRNDLGRMRSAGSGDVRDCKPCVFVHGDTGSGKTIAVAKAAGRAIMDGWPRSFCWTDEDTLKESAISELRGEVPLGPSLREIEEADLVVLDELMSRGLAPWLGSDGMRLKSNYEVSKMLRRRFDARRPTLLTSNRPPGDYGELFTDVFDERVGSRWRQVGVPAECTGVDMRRVAA